MSFKKIMPYAARLCICALVLMPLLSTFAFAKQESSDFVAPAVSAYGTYGSSIVPLQADADGTMQSRVGGFTTVIPSTPTITASAYTTGKVVGGVQSIASATRTGIVTGVVSSVLISDKANQKAPIDLFFFNASPSASTLTDTSTFTVNAADIGKYAGHISVAAADYAVDSAYAYASVINKNLAFKLASGTTLYCVAVIRGSVTYATTSDLTFSYKIYQD